MDGYECSGFYFYSNFDSGNLEKIENVTVEPNTGSPHTSFTGQVDEPDAEFNLWTKPDCGGTEFENGNRTWFYFGIKCSKPTSLIKFNMMNLNKQAKLYSQGMGPVYKIIPGRPIWERVCDKPTYTNDNTVFILSFKFRVPELYINSTIYLAFTYPFTFSELQMKLEATDKFQQDLLISLDEIYYHREPVCMSLEGRRVDLLTISSFHNISTERETRLKNLFPDNKSLRPFKFTDKKVIFLSARVHPGETPSSFVLNGFLNLLLLKEDPIAIILRKMYVFKLIPCLNPDGVVNGHYRTDTRGVNLNRVYLNPCVKEHPSIYAARALIRYYHYGFEKEDDEIEDPVQKETLWTDVSQMSIEDKNNKNVFKCKNCSSNYTDVDSVEENTDANVVNSSLCIQCGEPIDSNDNDNSITEEILPIKKDSGLFLYIDMHGHASKKGIFMYGNHFDDVESSIECMLLPKIMSINNTNFHFSACNFTEKNMYIKDKRDGMSKEGSGRVAVYKITGLIQSYTLECNYNTGRLVNLIPPTIKELTKTQAILVPPKYTPLVFEEVGKAIGCSILDLTSHNPHTRIPHSEYHTLNGVREFLRLNCVKESSDSKKPSSNSRFRHSSTLHAQGKAIRSVKLKTRSYSKFTPKKMNVKNQRTSKMPKKEKIRSPEIMHQAGCSHSITSFPAVGSEPVLTMIQVLKKQEEEEVNSSSRSSKTKSKSNTSALKIKQKLNTGKSKSKGKVDARPKSPKSPKLQKSPKVITKREIERTDRAKLKEICFVKDSKGGKKMIAKYENDKNLDDKLIVAWNANCSKPEVYSETTRLPAFLSSKAHVSEEASKRSVFRVHNFQKSNSAHVKVKRTKRIFKLTAPPPESKSKKNVLKKKSRIDTTN